MFEQIPPTTVTVTLLLAEPPVPLQLAAKTVLEVSAPEEMLVPATPPVCHAAPPFVTVQEVAFVEDHVMLEDAPEATDVGLAEMFTVGAGTTLTVTVSSALPPGPVQAIL